MIHFQSVSKFYDHQTALRNITFTVQKGEMLFITGPSGAGKTTLLRVIYHAIKPDEGNITISGLGTETIKDSQIPYLRRNIGVVFQDFRLLTNMNVFDNVAIALRLRGISERDIKPLALDALRLVNLRHKTDAFPLALSGGEQQRVVISRAIVAEPLILLADEPTGNLDSATSAGIMRIFKDINARGTTIIVATHNRELFKDTGKRLIRLENGSIQAVETA